MDSITKALIGMVRRVVLPKPKVREERKAPREDYTKRGEKLLVEMKFGKR